MEYTRHYTRQPLICTPCVVLQFTQLGLATPQALLCIKNRSVTCSAEVLVVSCQKQTLGVALVERLYCWHCLLRGQQCCYTIMLCVFVQSTFYIHTCVLHSGLAMCVARHQERLLQFLLTSSSMRWRGIG